MFFFLCMVGYGGMYEAFFQNTGDKALELMAGTLIWMSGALGAAGAHRAYLPSWSLRLRLAITCRSCLQHPSMEFPGNRHPQSMLPKLMVQQLPHESPDQGIGPIWDLHGFWYKVAPCRLGQGSCMKFP